MVPAAVFGKVNVDMSVAVPPGLANNVGLLVQIALLAVGAVKLIAFVVVVLPKVTVPSDSFILLTAPPRCLSKLIPFPIEEIGVPDATAEASIVVVI